MGIKIGDLDLANEIIDLHYQLFRTQLLLEEVLKNNTDLVAPSKERTRKIDDEAISLLQKKYPNMGISKME